MCKCGKPLFYLIIKLINLIAFDWQISGKLFGKIESWNMKLFIELLLEFQWMKLRADLPSTESLDSKKLIHRFTFSINGIVFR